MPGRRNQSLSVRHALQLMDHLTDASHQDGASLRDLVEATGLNKSTVLRLLAPLTETRLVQRDPATGVYRVGVRAVEWAGAYLAKIRVARIALPYLHRLVEATGETAFLVVYDEGDVIFVSKVESPNKVRMSSDIGTRTPAYSTANGKAILAFLPEAEVARVVASGLRPVTAHTITDRAAFLAQLEAIRQAGFAYDDRENAEDARCVGAPVFDFHGQVVAGISLSGPAFRIDAERVPVLGRMVLEASREISRELGYSNGTVR
jgi:IclR family acetate operon transcriptional repressor